MKTLNKIHLLIIIVFTITSTIACGKKKGCMDKNALNYNADAKEDDGSCKYERDDFLGSWNAVDSVQTPVGTWQVSSRVVTITKNSSTSDKVIVSQIMETSNLDATITGKAIVLVPNSGSTSGAYPITSGNGTVANNIIKIKYQPQQPYNECNITLSK